VLEALGAGPTAETDDEPGDLNDQPTPNDEPLLPNPTFGPPSEVSVAVGDNDDRRQ
jgi:hypothetical protein